MFSYCFLPSGVCNDWGDGPSPGNVQLGIFPNPKVFTWTTLRLDLISIQNMPQNAPFDVYASKFFLQEGLPDPHTFMSRSKNPKLNTPLKYKIFDLTTACP